ncbi:hypothetical protein N7G274_010331 [Stereocaulon virgatum]|uniref:Uncharacterized protein n=1 Tax=Stereocaulon virgatum TaxID=373712 RepID=A0ABR3ZW72_9LECA
MSGSMSEGSSQQKEIDVSPPSSSSLSSPDPSPSMIPAPLRGRTSWLEVTMSEDFDTSLVPASLKWAKSKPQDISSNATGTPGQEKNFSRPFTVRPPAPPSALLSAPKIGEASQPYQSSERDLQDVQSIQAPTSGKQHYSARRMCFRRGQRIHVALEDIQRVKKSSDQFYRDRAALKEQVLIGRPSDGDILLGRILLPEAVICKDPEREEYAWQVYDDPSFEPVTKKSFDSTNRVWALFSSLCRSGINVERIRPEHVLIHDFTRESSWTTLMLEPKRIEDIIRLVHVWTANEEQQSFQAHHLPRIIEKFRASLPSGIQQASFREPTDNLWHCRELSDEAIEICDEGFPTRRMLENHLVERHWVSKEEIYKEFQDDPHEEGLAEMDYRLLRFSAIPRSSV